MAGKRPRPGGGAKQPESRAGPKITMMWTYRASPGELWDLWTTKDGLESWWGPEEFVMRTRKLELRPGGVFEYAITAMDVPQVEALTEAGIPITRISRLTFLELVPRKRISYKIGIDYIPEVKPYDVSTTIEFNPVDKAVKMLVAQEPMHSAEWTQTLALSLDKQFNRLGKVIQARRDAEEEAKPSTSP